MLQSFLGTIRSAFMSRHIMSRSIRVQKRHGLLSTVQPLEPRVLLTVSPEEQLFVYMLNRARHNPVAYQDENSLPVDLGYVPSRPPLAVNDHLFASAEVHSNDMATNNYAGHYSPFLNKWPNRMVRDAGYALPATSIGSDGVTYVFADDGNSVESLAAGMATTASALSTLIVDAGVSGSGHRDHLLGISSFYSDSREIGVGHSFNSASSYQNYWVIHATRIAPTNQFLTGVVYNDANSNQRYDLNEGLAGVTISAGMYSATTNSHGGWSMPVPNGVYDVRASGGSFGGEGSVFVGASGANKEIDFVSGLATGYVNFSLYQNTAPTLAAGNTTLSPIVIGNPNQIGNTVASIVGSSITDPDLLAKRGIAVTSALSSSGTWQYSVSNGANWSNLSSATPNAALLLRDVDLIRFVPSGGVTGTASFSYRAWDQTSGSTGATADLSSGIGDHSAFSGGSTVSGVVNVLSTNTAPTLSAASPILTAVAEDTNNSPGSTIASFLGTSGTDVDPGTHVGIAVIGTDGVPGNWQYSVDGGVIWNLIGSAQANNARLLRNSDRLRFVSDANVNGQATITYRAWDESVGSGGATVNLTPVGSTGGSTAFSSGTATASITITPVNDSPVVDPVADFVLPSVLVNTTFPSSGTVASWLNGGITDVDSGAKSGIAVIGLTGNGTWWFNTGSWWSMSPVNSMFAVLLRDTDRIAFTPAAGWTGAASFTFRAWDQTTGIGSRNVDLTNPGSYGGVSAYSATTGIANLTVTTTLGVAPAVTTNPISQSKAAGQTVAFTAAASGTPTPTVKWQVSTDGGSTFVNVVGATSTTYSFAVQASQNGNRYRAVFSNSQGSATTNAATLTANAAPSDIALSNSNVPENSAVGTSVGTLSAADPDAGDTFTYALVSGTGSTNNGSFTINGNSLKTAASFNFEAKRSYAIRVKVTDAGGLSYEKQFTIAVTNVNEAPTAITLSATSVLENKPIGTAVGAFSTTDPDAADTRTYALVSGTGSTNNGSFTINGNSLKTAAIFDFETKSSYVIRVKVTDAGGKSFEKQFTISVTNVNEVPTAITLSATSVLENKPIGTAVGAFTAIDPDAGGTFTYSLVSGTGGTDNGSFSIAGNTLKTNAVFNFETKSSYSIRIRTTDQSGLWFEKSVNISVVSENTPGDAEIHVASYIRENGFNSPAMATDSNGNFVIAWESKRQDANGFVDVYAQRYNAAGTAQGAGFLVNTYTTNGQYRSSVAMDADGDFVIAWQSEIQDGSGYGVYAQRYNAAGTPQGVEFRVNSSTTGNEKAAAIAMDPAGNFVITWERTPIGEAGSDGSGSGVYAQRYNAAGTAQGGEFRVNSFITGDQGGPDVAVDADGDFVITWYSNGQDSSGYGVYAQRFNAAGTPQGGEVRVNSFTTGNQFGSDIAMDTAGNFVVAWVSAGQDGSYFGIYAQRFNAAGAPQGGELRVNSDITFDQKDPSIAMDGVGNFVVAWLRFGYTTVLTQGVYAQRYSPAGSPIATEFQVNSTPTSTQNVYPVIAMMPAGNFVIAWNTGYQTDNTGDIYAQQYHGTTPPTNTPPTNIALSNSNIPENRAIGTSVGTFTAADPDAGDIFTYALVSGTGSTNNGSFTINGNSLKTAAIFDFETKSSYAIRVKVTDAGGKSFEKQFTISVMNVIEGVVITGPAATTTAQRPVFSWTAVPGATSYEIWVTKDPSTSPYHQATVTGTSYRPPTALGIGTFNLWVRSFTNAVPSPWTPKYTFVIHTAAVMQPIARSQPTLRPTISWDALPGAVKYDVWINDVSRSTTQYIRNTNVTGTSFTPSADMPMGIYRAWVRGIAADGTPGDWSGAIEYVTMQAPTITAPLNSTFNQRPVFTWNPIAGATSYELQIRNRNTGAITYNQTGLTVSNWTPPSNLPAGPYRWWVVANGLYGLRGFWTAPVDISIGGDTELLTPIGTISNRRPTFTWKTVDGAVRYELSVTNATLNMRTIYETNLTTTSYTPPTSLATGTYRAWVRAVSSSGSFGPWSPEANFVIAQDRLDDHKLSDPPALAMLEIRDVLNLNLKFSVEPVTAGEQRLALHDTVMEEFIHLDFTS